MSKSYPIHDSSVEAQFERVFEVAECTTQTELADFLGIKQSSVSDAKRRKKIPSSWLVILMRVKNVFPEWILTEKGQRFVTLPPPQASYETGDVYTEQRADEQALKRLSSQMLADELIRRIAVSQSNAFYSELNK